MQAAVKQHICVIIAVLLGLSPLSVLVREYSLLRHTVTPGMLAAVKLGDEGEAYAMQGKPQLALSYYQKALSLDPRNSLTYLRLANLYYFFNDIPKAAEYCRKAIQYDPNSSEGHNKLGVMMAIQGDMKQAVEFFSRAVEIAPNNLNAKENLHRALQQLERQR